MRLPFEISPTGCARAALIVTVLWASTSGLATLLEWSAPAVAEEGGRRATMQVIFDNVQTLLRLSATDRELERPEHAESFLSAAFDIEEQAALLANHIGPAPDASFLAETLSRSAFRVGRFYELGQLEVVRYLVDQMVDVCVACHTRMPSTDDSPLAAHFIATVPVQSLTAIERARLQIATRRFDDALDTLELILGDPQVSQAVLDTAVISYLTVAIRVKGELPRALKTLDALAAHSPSRTHVRFAHWRGVLAHELDAASPHSLEKAVRLIEQGERHDAETSMGGIVSYVLASATLNRLVEAKVLSPNELSRGYYLLGLTEYRLNPSGWIPQAELFLEMAILNGPATDNAQAAFRLLEQKVTESYTNVLELTVPQEVREHLDFLKAQAYGV